MVAADHNESLGPSMAFAFWTLPRHLVPMSAVSWVTLVPMS